MAKQINLIPNPQPPRFSDYRKVKVTAKNEFIFKSEAKKWYESGHIPSELHDKIQNTQYAKL
jgi:hypothetical protein